MNKAKDVFIILLLFPFGRVFGSDEGQIALSVAFEDWPNKILSICVTNGLSESIYLETDGIYGFDWPPGLFVRLTDTEGKIVSETTANSAGWWSPYQEISTININQTACDRIRKCDVDLLSGESYCMMVSFDTITNRFQIDREDMAKIECQFFAEGVDKTYILMSVYEFETKQQTVTRLTILSHKTQAGSHEESPCPFYHQLIKEPPDLCVVLVDSLRADHLGCYGCERDTSPAVDAFAAGAVRFDQAIASGSWTQPSIMSMMASVPADVHQRVHWGRPHSTNVVTLAETLQKAGYQTVGLVANPMTNRRFGFARGFDFYDDYSLTGAPDATTGDIARQTAQGAKLTRLARDWIERRRDPEKPLFLFVLYIDVHWDYLPPPPFNRMFAPDPVPPPRDIWNLGRASVPEAARRRSVAAYDGEIRYTDGCVSNLLAAIDASPRGKDTVVVFCSDHGESFWERGLASHGNALFDEELRVPLVIRPARGDGEPAPPRVVPEQVGLIDLAPTLADLAGVPAPTNWVGRSLAPALRGETLPEVPIVLDNRIGDDGAILRGVRTSRWKVVAGPPHDRPTSLYDLRADPAETNDLLRAGDFALPPDVEDVVPLLKPTK